MSSYPRTDAPYAVATFSPPLRGRAEANPTIDVFVLALAKAEDHHGNYQVVVRSGGVPFWIGCDKVRIMPPIRPAS